MRSRRDDVCETKSYPASGSKNIEVLVFEGRLEMADLDCLELG